MAYYIKAHPNVADILGLKGLCTRTADGNVLLWQADMQKTGCVVLADAVACVGGVLLTPEQARAERKGEQCASLPFPIDPRFSNGIKMDIVEEVGEVNDTPTEGDEV